MNILITGGAGFIGSHLSEKLIDLGHKVVVVDNLINGNKKNLNNILNHKNFKFENIDIRETQPLKKYLKVSI